MVACVRRAGVWRIDSGVDAICRYSDPTRTGDAALLGHGRRSAATERLAARQEIRRARRPHYVGTVDIEAKCMVDMINKRRPVDVHAGNPTSGDRRHRGQVHGDAPMPQVAAVRRPRSTRSARPSRRFMRRRASRRPIWRARYAWRSMIDIRRRVRRRARCMPGGPLDAPRRYTDRLFLDQHHERRQELLSGEGGAAPGAALEELARSQIPARGVSSLSGERTVWPRRLVGGHRRDILRGVVLLSKRYCNDGPLPSSRPDLWRNELPRHTCEEHSEDESPLASTRSRELDDDVSGRGVGGRRRLDAKTCERCPCELGVRTSTRTAATTDEIMRKLRE